MEKVMNIGELAEVLRVSRPVVYEAVRSGKLPAARIGRQWRITESALNKFLRGGGGGQEDGYGAGGSRAT